MDGRVDRAEFDHLGAQGGDDARGLGAPTPVLLARDVRPQPADLLLLGAAVGVAALPVEGPRRDLPYLEDRGFHAVHRLDARRHLVDSYHCSRYNTNTRRLTDGMFREVFAAIASHLGMLRKVKVETMGDTGTLG